MDFELPDPHEKLPHKYILDALREIRAKKNERNEEEQGVCSQPTHIFEAVTLVKNYYRIKEVAQIVGVEPYTVRYWESEFKHIHPMKSQSGQRVYSKSNVEDFLQIKELVHTQKFSLKGAKKRLIELKKTSKSTNEKMTPQKPDDTSVLNSLAKDLRDLISLARGNPGMIAPNLVSA